MAASCAVFRPGDSKATAIEGRRSRLFDEQSSFHPCPMRGDRSLDSLQEDGKLNAFRYHDARSQRREIPRSVDLSVVSQAGPFTIRYHVQDGGSKDRTLEILAAWQTRLARDFPLFCEGIEFSFASAPDRHLFEAVNRGFSACAYADADAMTWIGFDDRFEPGAFATVEEVFRLFPDIDWVTGRTTVLNEAGMMLFMPPPIYPFPRQAIAAGIFDCRFVTHCIEQEATFWRPRLWQKAGGLDPNFRLAGDFDLWRRFARHTDLVVVDKSWVVFGCGRARFRRTCQAIAPKSTHRFRPLKSKRAPRS